MCQCFFSKNSVSVKTFQYVMYFYFTSKFDSKEIKLSGIGMVCGRPGVFMWLFTFSS